jgi:hypothetical protein
MGKPTNGTFTIGDEIDDNHTRKTAVYYAEPSVITLTYESSYFLRSVDIVGNITDWYVWLNRDKSRMQVMEDNTVSEGTINPTANLILPDSMANMNYVSLRFTVSADGKDEVGAPVPDMYIVDKIAISYYAFDFDSNQQTNPNWPFSQFKTGYDLPLYDRTTWLPAPAAGDEIDIPIMPNRAKTADGLYVLSRSYTYTPNAHTMFDPYDRKDAVRNYFFIVDRNDIIPFKADPFTSQVKMKFGDRYADYTHFRNPETIQTNALADLYFPTNGSKYGNRIDFPIGYVEYNDAGYPQNKSTKKLKALLLNATGTFDGKALNNGKRIEFNESTSGPWISRPLSSSSYNTFSNSGLYALSIRDGSGGVKPMPIAQSSRVVRGNSAEIVFRIAAGDAPVFWYVREEQLPKARQFARYELGDKLEFAVENEGGDSNFYAEIDHTKTVLLLGDDRDGIRLTEIQPEIVDREGNVIQRASYLKDGVKIYDNIMTEGKYGNVTIKKYDISKFVLEDHKSVEAHLSTVNNVVTIPDKLLTFDNIAPEYNLKTKSKRTDIDGSWLIETEAIQKTDTLFPGSPNDPSSKYVYSVPREFVFNNYAPNDTNEIYFREVDRNLTQIVTNFTKYKYHTANATNGKGQSFSSVINLLAGEIRIFNIREYDEAGNCADYYIKLRGRDYTDYITITGTKTTNLLAASRNIFGTDIAVTDAVSFWDDNPNFKMDYTLEGLYGDMETDDKFHFERYKYNDDALKSQTAPTAMRAFENFLRDMLENGRGKKIHLVLDDGFGARPEIKITQATETTPRPIIITSADSFTGFLNVAIKNRTDLGNMFVGLNFYITIYSAEGGQMAALPLVNEQQFNLDTTFTDFLSNLSYVIIVRDDFNRKTTAEHHSADGLYCNIIYNGDHRWNEGIHYVGHPDGVQIQWNDNTYGLTIDGEVVDIHGKDRNRVTKMRADVEIYSINVYPNTRINDQSSHTATLTYRVSGGEWNGFNKIPNYDPDNNAVPDWPAAWTFYFVLPELQFRTINGTGISPEDLKKPEGLKGMVEVTLDRRGFIFQTDITYILFNPNGTTENLQINRFATRFILDRVGTFRIRVSNDVSASRTTEVKIAEVDNLNYKVRNLQNGTWVDLDESPELFDINSVAGMRTGVTLDPVGTVRNIPVYWFSSGDATRVDINTTLPYINDYNRPNPAPTIEIVPSLNQNRRLVAIGDTVTNAGYAWKYYYLENTDSHVRMYFILACAPAIGLDANLIDQSNQSTITGTHQIYSAISPSGIRIRLQSNVANDDFTPRRTNVYYAEYIHNGVVGGRAFGHDTIKIDKADYGIIELRVRDWAGNTRPYGTRDCFTFYNFSVPPVLIASGSTQNFETIVDEMVYNNSFTLRVITDLPDYVTERNEYYFIRQLRVWRDGVIVEDFKRDAKHESTQFTFAETGRYVIETVYATYQTGVGTTDVISTHAIQLINSSKFMQSFMFAGASNISISTVTFGGRADITYQFGSVTPLKSLYISPQHGEGRYTLTFQIAATNLRPGYAVNRDLLIAPLGINRAAISASHAFGNEYKEEISIMFKPIDIMRICNDGTATVKIFRDGVEFANYDISTEMMIEIEKDKFVARDINEIITHTVGEVGQYTVVVSASNGTTVFVDGFTITQSSNTTMVYIGIGAGVAFFVFAVMFVRLRSRMRVK